MKKLIYLIFVGVSLLLILNSCGGGGDDTTAAEPKIEVSYPESGEIVARVNQSDGDAYLNYYGSSIDDITKILGNIEGKPVEVLYDDGFPSEVSVDQTKILYTYSTDETIDYKYYYNDTLESESSNVPITKSSNLADEDSKGNQTKKTGEAIGYKYFYNDILESRSSSVVSNLSDEDFKALIVVLFSIARGQKGYIEQYGIQSFMYMLLTDEGIRKILHIQADASQSESDSSESDSNIVLNENSCPAYEVMVDGSCKNYNNDTIPTNIQIENNLDAIEDNINRVCNLQSSQDYTTPADTSSGNFIRCSYDDLSMAQTPYENHLKNGTALYNFNGKWAYAPFTNDNLNGWYYHLYEDNSVEELSIHDNGTQTLVLRFEKDTSWSYGINNEIYVKFHSNLNQVKDVVEYENGQRTRSMLFDINGNMTDCMLWKDNSILASCME